MAGPRAPGWLPRDRASPSSSQGWVLRLLSSGSLCFGKCINSSYPLAAFFKKRSDEGPEVRVRYFLSPRAVKTSERGETLKS